MYKEYVVTAPNLETTDSILGGVQKMAYMPMSGQLVYRISEV